MASTTLQRRTPSLGALSTITPPHSQHSTPSLAPTTSSNTPPPGTSLYHTCRLVLDKLAFVPGMSCWLDMEEDNLSPSLSPINTSSPPLMPLSTTSPALTAASTSTADSAITTTSCSTNNFNSDPLSKLCYLCRRGTPLFTLFNALNTNQPLKMDPNPKLNQVNNCKANVYHFLVACRKQLLFPEEELFAVSDLYVDDTNGFVKVVNTVLKILQLLEDKGIISSQCASRDSCPMVPPKDIRDQVVFELLSTERKYVQDLETLQTYMRELQQQRILSQDTVHYLFGNLNALVDFQRRFLIEMEKTAENQPQDQHFGLLFSQMEGAFSVYEPYCSNFYSAQDLVVQEAPKLQKLNIMNPTHQLTSLLIKPIQRICKYPLLLNELIKSTNKEWSITLSEMADGLDTMRRVADKVNETQRKHENLQMVVELKRRVDDWKGISIDKCGQLLLQDKMVVSAYDNEREMHIFFFENRLLLCKECKDNNKNRNTITIKKRRRGTLEPKGKIETSMITCIHNISKNGEWALMIEWKEQDVEKFILKFRNEEQYKLWESTLNKQKGFQSTPSISSSSNNHVSGINSTMPTSLPLPQLLSSNDNWSFIDPDDEEDEVDFIEDDGDYHGSGARSRSNSFSAHILNTFSTRPKSSRNNSTDMSAMKSLTVNATTGRPNTPGLNLQPLPRSNHGIPIHQHDVSQQPSSGDYFFYPSSPPPSNPSSPTSSSRVSPNNSSSGRSFRDHTSSSSQQLHHHYLQQQQQHYSTKGLPMPREPMTPAMDYFTIPTIDNFDAVVGRPGPSLSERHQYQQHQHHNNHHHRKQMPPPTRSRAQSSPIIQSSESHIRRDGGGMTRFMDKSATWEQYTHQPTTAPLPRLSDKKSSVSLHSQMDHILISSVSTTATATATTTAPVSPGQLKVKMIYNDGAFSLVIPQHISYIELMERVEQKLHAMIDLRPGTSFRLKYRDEEGDFITMSSTEDVQMAFDGYQHSGARLYVFL
ncbi:hypothetical protein BCR42DRAFT_51753 [Absidia repens]|uniref:RhoGEF domain-domain-containing protein n=1 Tax=Absidia repens TaxID=90262 RepID=A0A1X2IF96_9FUNG|nr:hypothetical protein BCR42DRAFT_51753 [Absidia repens]